MCHLVKDDVCTTFSCTVSYATAKYQYFLTEGNYAGVLHRAPVEIKDCDLVVLFEWVGKSEDLFEIGESLFGMLENLFRI